MIPTQLSSNGTFIYPISFSPIPRLAITVYSSYPAPAALLTVSINLSHSSGNRGQPHLLIINPGNGLQTGNITFHSVMSSDIDLQLHGKHFILESNGFSDGNIFKNSSSGGKFRWKDKGALKNSGGELQCKEKKTGDMVARLITQKWGKLKREGRVEIGAAVAGQQALVEEVIVTGLAMVEYQLKTCGEDKGEDSAVAAQITSAVLGVGS